MFPDLFVKDYKAALATQQWQNVEPLIHANCCVTFSNGAVYKGIEAVKAAYERNFALIKNEDYQMSNIHWALQSETVAVYLFDFSWQGIINGEKASGGGKGTSVIVCEGGKWKLMAEHLGKAGL
ncbi:MAG: nuclear transport factor 2 family protein [Chitinophagales bacterium]|nr:nuclear transport factor 2 family protein [Chitinophagales bacterium]